jgi:hypothetical protein
MAIAGSQHSSAVLASGEMSERSMVLLSNQTSSGVRANTGVLCP